MEVEGSTKTNCLYQWFSKCVPQKPGVSQNTVRVPQTHFFITISTKMILMVINFIFRLLSKTPKSDY